MFDKKAGFNGRKDELETRENGGHEDLQGQSQQSRRELLRVPWV